MGASKCEIIVSVDTTGELNKIWHKYLATGNRLVYISLFPNIKGDRANVRVESELIAN